LVQGLAAGVHRGRSLVQLSEFFGCLPSTLV
jgi:hypothetical protein